MLRLFYSPGACSLVTHIALEETGSKYEAVRVMLAEGEHLRPDYIAINPHARVPALANSHGIVTENIAILNLIADIFEAPGSVPRDDPFAAARCNEMLGWFASSVHISFAQIWRGERFTNEKELWPAIKDGGMAALQKQFAEIEQRSGESWLVDGHFTAADSYALTFFRWGKRIGMDMGGYPAWSELLERVLERPAVRRVIEQEGLKVEEFRPA